MSEPKQIEIDINRKVLEEMLLRLENTKWPPIVGEDSWDYGVPKQWMQDMTNYWTTEWKWDNVATQINEWDHFSVTIDQVPIHYLHAPGKGPNPEPLILTHGWPWTFGILKMLSAH